MVRAVARHGYAGTTLRELVRLAGVSKTTFYEHFDDKQECFLSTFDEIASQVAERMDCAYREGGDARGRLTAALTVFMKLIVSEPEAAMLLAVESLALGKAGVAHRERGSEAFEAMIRQSVEPPSPELEVSSITIRAIASGIRGVTYRKLRAGEIEELPSLVEEMVEWALGYQQADGEVVTLAAAAAAEPRDKRAPGPGPDDLDWREPPDSPRSRAALTQRERIVRAVGQLVAESGYQTLSIPKISATAGTSNQTFYEHFNNKLEAFLTVFDVSLSAGLLAATEAFEAAGDTPSAVGAAIRALLEHIATDELFARIAFFDVLTAGPMALDRADAALDSFTSFLRPRVASQGVDTANPDALLQAVGCGIWSVIQHEIAVGRRASLPELGTELARIVLAPWPR